MSFPQPTSSLFTTSSKVNQLGSSHFKTTEDCGEQIRAYNSHFLELRVNISPHDLPWKTWTTFLSLTLHQRTPSLHWPHLELVLSIVAWLFPRQIFPLCRGLWLPMVVLMPGKLNKIYSEGEGNSYFIQRSQVSQGQNLLGIWLHATQFLQTFFLHRVRPIQNWSGNLIDFLLYKWQPAARSLPAEMGGGGG